MFSKCILFHPDNPQHNTQTTDVRNWNRELRILFFVFAKEFNPILVFIFEYPLYHLTLRTINYVDFPH